MALPIEGFSVVAQLERIQHLLDDDKVMVPNATALHDAHLFRCSFMARSDAEKFLGSLEALGLNTSQGPDPDAVIVFEWDRSVEPYCEWLKTAFWEKAVIAWKEGTSPDTVTAREGWDPKVGSGLDFHDPEAMKSIAMIPGFKVDQIAVGHSPLREVAGMRVGERRALARPQSLDLAATRVEHALQAP